MNLTVTKWIKWEQSQKKKKKTFYWFQCEYKFEEQKLSCTDAEWQQEIFHKQINNSF